MLVDFFIVAPCDLYGFLATPATVGDILACDARLSLSRRHRSYPRRKQGFCYQTIIVTGFLSYWSIRAMFSFQGANNIAIKKLQQKLRSKKKSYSRQNMNRPLTIIATKGIINIPDYIRCHSWVGTHDWCLADWLLVIADRLRYFSDFNISMIQYIFWNVNNIFVSGCFRWGNGLFYCENDEPVHRFVRMWGEKKWMNISHVPIVWI